MIYLDSVASYPSLPEVDETLYSTAKNNFANPSSSHSLGEQGKELVEGAREATADSIGALSSEVVFTSGATESNNLIIKGVILPLLLKGQKPHLITSILEHKCVLSISRYLESLGCEVTYLHPNSDGEIQPSIVKSAFRENTALVSIMHVNNELGTINPIAEIGEICMSEKIPLHTDAAQSYLKLETDVDELNVDFMSLSSHKVGGPKGVGIAYIRDLKDLDISPVVHGAGQEFGLRGGTLPTPLIAAFGVAIQSFSKYYTLEKTNKLKKQLLEGLEKANIKYRINGGRNVIPSCISLTLSSSNIQALLRCNHASLALSQGSACSARSIEPSHVLTALNFDREQASKTLRISFSHKNTGEDIKTLLDEIIKFTGN
ncbi:MAG: aminotransferase [Idiomarinaceae bacterium]|nr:aminotransferase [Idiomarinaceae bacterium]MBG24290.1 aminotransferase [Idiomarinaceae bacterium]